MWPRWLVPRYSIRTLLILVALVAVGLWSYLYLPGILHDRQDAISRAAIDPYELSIAGNGDPADAPPELVAILGDSRLKHWWRPLGLSFLNRQTLFTFGQDETARIWDTRTGRQLRWFPAVAGAANQAGDKVFLGSARIRDGVEVWNTTTWKIEQTLHCREPHRVLGFRATPDGNTLAVLLGEPQKERYVQVWDVPRAKLLNTFAIPPNSHSLLALDDEGRRLAHLEGFRVKVVDVQTGATLGDFDPFAGQPERAAIYVALFDKTAGRLLIGGADGKAVAFYYASGQRILEIPDEGVGSITSLVFSEDKSHLTVSQNQGARQYYRTPDGWRLIRDFAPDQANRAAITSIAVEPGLFAFGGHDHSILLADFQGPIILSGGNKPDVTRLAFDHQDRFLATSARDGQITVWNRRTWRPVRSWQADRDEIWQLAFAPNGTLVAGGPRGIALWNAETGTEERIIKPRMFFHRYFAISPDGQFIVAPHHANSPGIGIWKRADGTLHKTIVHTAASVRGELVFDPSGDTLVMGGGTGAATIWDLENSKFVGSLPGRTIHNVPLAMHQDGMRVLAAPWYGPIEVWHISTQKKLLSVRVHRGNAMVSSIAIHPKGKWAASAANDGAACLWDIDTGAVVKSWQLGPPKGIVFQVAFSPDGRYLATVNGNGTAYILRLDGIGTSSAASSGAVATTDNAAD